jgi:hypothetical protein
MKNLLLRVITLVIVLSLLLGMCRSSERFDARR